MNTKAIRALLDRSDNWANNIGKIGPYKPEECASVIFETNANIRRELGDDVSKSLLQHLTLLTVAERETVIRTAEIATSMKLASRIGDGNDSASNCLSRQECVQEAIEMIRTAEFQLRGALAQDR